MPPRSQKSLIPLREVITQVTGQLLDHPVGRAQRLWREWVEVVGPLLARHTEPLRLSDGTLTIRVDSPAWKSELEFIKPDLLERLAPLLPPGELKQINLKQGTLRLLPGVQCPASPDLHPWPSPLPGEVERVQSMVASITDPGLQAVLYRLGIKLMIRNRAGK
ncbi:MAG: DUF721 domain-containing protein [Magnetococcales bacterium]|nr:DUF721 domain-containing protein [Magnetococcales bacterium]